MDIQSLEVKDLTKEFITKNDKIIAVDKVNYKFEKGKFYAIMGHSGSGKSTLISILGTLEQLTSGEYLINDQKVSNFSEDDLSNIRLKGIGFIFQNYALDPNLKAYENVMLPMFINDDIPKSDRKVKAQKLLEYVNLSERINHFPKELSGGEQQRVAIARALANDPSVILADEPTGNLDEENESVIFKILKSIAESGKCVIVVSHDNNVLNYADVILKMTKGKLGDQDEG